MTYRAPISEQRFVLDSVADIGALSTLPGFEAATPDMVQAILAEAGRFAETIFAPLNHTGDRIGSRYADGQVTTPPGFAEAWARYVDAGWNGLSAHPDHGGQGLPFCLSVAVQEQMTSANMAFSLCPMLTLGVVEALSAHGNDAQKTDYLPRLVSGEWTGTMNLTEPQAGSDVGALTSTAEPLDDGRYAVRGAKIFITWGEHDVAANILHLVLARLPDAPAGTKGISLFLVPKYLPDGSRNGVRCTGIEHKLGIHASPTCQMAFGADDPAIGWLVGPEHGGMRAMFTMMNHARISVALQGVAIAERACQGAVAFAAERIQSPAIGSTDRKPVAIIDHPDVRRMLLTIRSHTDAARAIVYLTAAAVDRAHGETDPDRRAAAKARADLLTPVAKAWATDIGVEMSSLAVQVFGGMGYVEETGAAQHMRDARIAPIYEGTNGIQALDLVGRKLPADGARAFNALLADWRVIAAGLTHATARDPLIEALATLDDAARWIIAHPGMDAAAGAGPMLRLFGTVAGALLLACQADRAAAMKDLPTGFAEDKATIATFFIDQLLPPALALLPSIKAGCTPLLRLSFEGFAR